MKNVKKIRDGALFIRPRSLKCFADDAVIFDGDIIAC